MIYKILMMLLLLQKQTVTTSEVQYTNYTEEEVVEFEEKFLEPVIFTNYYANDATGSTHRTGSGYSTKDFKVNEKGWYTYDSKVVVATATYECLESNYIGCKNFTELPEGYLIYNYGDTFQFMFDNELYEAIVLDSCGACSRVNEGEEYQRFDIFIKNKTYSFGKKQGEVIYLPEN